MGREFELKYKADGQVLSAIRDKFGGFTSISMETAYFDTKNADFAQRKWMLRRRLENGVSVCTLKTPLPDGSRGEWETGSEDLESALPALVQLGAPAELASLARDGLVQSCAARFRRLAAVLTLEECTVEIALDEGCFLGGGQEMPFAEVEVELKDGSQEAAETFAAGLAAEFGLRPEPKSKAQRARELAV